MLKVMLQGTEGNIARHKALYQTLRFEKTVHKYSDRVAPNRSHDLLVKQISVNRYDNTMKVI